MSHSGDSQVFVEQDGQLLVYTGQELYVADGDPYVFFAVPGTSPARNNKTTSHGSLSRAPKADQDRLAPLSPGLTWWSWSPWGDRDDFALNRRIGMFELQLEAPTRIVLRAFMHSARILSAVQGMQIVRAISDQFPGAIWSELGPATDTLARPHAHADTFLNVAAIRRRTRVNGPGWRAAVWVQGCTIGCPGCFNPNTHPHQARQLWDPDLLAEHLVQGEVEGISILGGEPFEQAAACARLARHARDLGASVVTYSGYTAASLRASTLPEVQALLAATDLLIAGPYIARRGNDGRGWHGSTNQELVFLTSRYNEEIRAQFDALEVVELRTDGTTIDWTGIPSGSDTESLYNLGRRH